MFGSLSILISQAWVKMNTEIQSVEAWLRDFALANQEFAIFTRVLDDRINRLKSSEQSHKRIAQSFYGKIMKSWITHVITLFTYFTVLENITIFVS